MINTILTDIEGTTTSIAFVHEVLFPYARKHLPEFIRSHQNNDEVKQWLGVTRADSGQPGLNLEETIALLLQWMAEDRKSTPLKALQGLLWKQGYDQADYQGHVYQDAAQALQAWQQQGLSLYVFSSGSVAAQKLLFSSTPYGDMTPLFKGYFDTGTGAKKKPDSYTRIAKAIGQDAEKILFLSDITEELDAAAMAGMLTCRLVRDGEMELGYAHPQVRSFADVRLNPDSVVQIFNDPSMLKAPLT